MDKRRPLRSKNLKVINYINTLYATFDGSSMWEIDKSSFGVLKMCDGKTTVDEIAKKIAKIIKMDYTTDHALTLVVQVTSDYDDYDYNQYRPPW